jgi:hypothetical protein
MSFALWITGDVAWAQGTCESRPMGTAVISVTDLFKRRDFRRTGRAPSPLDPGYLGLFASMGALNAQLRARRRPARRINGVAGRADRSMGALP